MVRQRRKPASDTIASEKPHSARSEPRMTTERAGGTEPAQWSTRTQWIFFAMASGVCAAFNGAFAKLTTTELTTRLSNAISNLVGLSEYENVVEYVVRAMFFILNLVFNGVMWSLFTTALARGTSATQVSIMNTSTNFIVTALLGIAVFSERLPPLWWAGASLLVVGNVITGRTNDGDDSVSADATREREPLIVHDEHDATEEATELAYRDQDAEDVLDLPVQ
ncbi:transcription initiation factor IIA small subunit [Cordyceps militaris]|uniref:Transcription initiation factor IIA small subunit n=1 Tax=Cordyceps militaris TaxID=73501 RepID=A0A2H4SLH2_CORMI|nr:transcription initiation factor IIA small subunit [Cordyceps militaris]